MKVFSSHLLFICAVLFLSALLVFSLSQHSQISPKEFTYLGQQAGVDNYLVENKDNGCSQTVSLTQDKKYLLVHPEGGCYGKIKNPKLPPF